MVSPERIQQHRKRRQVVVVVMSLFTTFLFLGIFEAAHESATADEPTYVEAGYDLIRGRLTNPEHPPAAKFLFGLSGEIFAQPRPLEDSPGLLPWSAGKGLVPARGVAIGITILLGALVFAWARSFSTTTGVAALALFLLDPTVIAHGHLATLDMSTAASFALACFLGKRLDDQPTFKRFLAVALVVALALLTKWVAVVLILALPLAAAAGAIGRSEGLMAALRRSALQLLAAISGLGLMVLVYLVFLNFSNLIEGLRFQVHHAKVGHINFLLGNTSTRGHWYYFPLALAIKTPLAFFPLVAIGVFQRFRQTFLWVPAAVFFGASLASSINIGIRYLLPIFPMLYVLAGAGSAYLLGCKRLWRRMGALALLVGFTASSLGTFPRHLEYFNELAELSHWRGQDLLNDSNADWGQGLKYLASDLENLRIDKLCLDYFGSHILTSYSSKFPDFLALYGSHTQLVAPSSCKYAAISSLTLFINPAYASLRTHQPLNSGPIFIFDLQGCRGLEGIPPCVRNAI